MVWLVSILLAQIKEADAKRGLYMQEVFGGKGQWKIKVKGARVRRNFLKASIQVWQSEAEEEGRKAGEEDK